jgi:1,4-alpha-glucan branching enzyme
LALAPKLQLARVSPSSWGYKGYNEMWLNCRNDWIYPHLHAAADRMVEVAASRSSVTVSEQRALNQAARELLLAQASDWAFIMSQDTVVPYAVQRTKQHIARFFRLVAMVETGAIDETVLGSIEVQDNLFPNIDFRVYRADYKLAVGPREGIAGHHSITKESM